MLGYAALIAALALVALVVAIIPVLVQLTRTARTAEQALATAEREIRPVTSQLQALLQEHRGLAEQATRDLRRIEGLVDKGQEALGRVTALAGLLGSVGTVGRALGVAQALRKGLQVFVHRLGRRRSP